MPVNKNAQLRHNILIRMMREGLYPNHPKIERELRRLDPAGAVRKISAKTIQRDVVYLNEVFFADTIKYNREERGYFLSNPYKDNYVPNMDEREVDAVMFGAHFAEALIPQIKLTNELRFGSDKVLGRNPPSEPDTITLNSIIAYGSRLKIVPAIFQTAFEAWQRHNFLALRYKRGSDGKELELRIAPHIIAYFENVWYLRAEILQSDNFKPDERTFWTLAMHRIQGAVNLGGGFTPDNAEIQKVHDGFLFDLPRLPEVKLQLRDSALSALEYLGATEEIKQADGSVIATVQGLEEFRILNLVLASGGNAIVVAPEHLRQKAIELATNFIDSQNNCDTKSSSL